MFLPKNQTDRTDCEIELPQAIVETFARFLVPEIRKYYDSEQGQREFAEWQETNQMEESWWQKGATKINCFGRSST